MRIAALCLPLRGLVVIVIAVTLVAAGLRTAKATDTDQAAFEHPHADDVVTLRNQVVFVAVSPKLGRIVGFGPVDGTNLLWVGEAQDVEGTWKNYGGDKLWPSPQRDWPQTHGRGWPPVPGIDGPAWKLIAASRDSVIIESPVSPVLGVKVRREIMLVNDQAHLIVRNVVTRVTPSQTRVHAWPVTQVIRPDFALIDVQELQPDSEAFRIEGGLPGTVMATREVADGVYRFDVPEQGDHRIGSFGNWVAAVYPTWILAQYSSSIEPEADYAHNSNVQLASEGGDLQLELTSPAKTLDVGERLELRVNWRLYQRPKPASDAQLGRLIEAGPQKLQVDDVMNLMPKREVR